MIKAISVCVFLGTSILRAQPLIGTTSLNAGWLWPKGMYTLVIHDGPGPRTEDIAAYLRANGTVADFFQTLCHYTGQPWADTRSAMCFQQHLAPLSLVNQLLSLHQCIGNHGQDHLDTPTLNQADTVYQIGNATGFLQPYWETQNCPALLAFPGFQTDPQHTAWLNQDPATAGRQQGPIWADFTGSGAIQTSSGPVSVGSDQDCFTQGFSQQQCLGVMLDAMAQANHGGIVNIHDYNPYAKSPLDPTSLKSAYAYDYLVGIFNGCQAANNGTPCIWVTPDAIPGVHRALSAGPFSLVSNSSDDFSNRIADVLVGDLDGDSFPDVVLPRGDGLYCALNAGNGTLYPLQRCLTFTDSGAPASQYWIADLDGDSVPYVVWLNATGLVGAKADGHGGLGLEVHIPSPGFSESKLSAGGLYTNSIRFGTLRAGSSLPDIVAMSPLGVVIATNNGHGFDPIHRVAHLTYDSEKDTTWNPQQAGKNMVLADLFGGGALDIVIAGNAGLFYASPERNGFTIFKPLTKRDGFDYWSSPQLYTSLNGAQIGGRTAITGWTPVGIAFANFTTADRHPAMDQFQMLCSDCFLSLPGWLDQWQQSNMTAAPFQGGFADFKRTGAPQAFAVWEKGLYASDVATLAGYR